jgi:hypothetical protein
MKGAQGLFQSISSAGPPGSWIVILTFSVVHTEAHLYSTEECPQALSKQNLPLSSALAIAEMGK